MEKYKITVNGTVYEVEVELMKDVPAQEKPAEKTPSASANAQSAVGQAVNAPMPGTILSVNVTEGQSVKKGDVLFILEAMKMENEITSPADGVVANLSVKKGDAVTTGASLCSLA